MLVVASLFVLVAQSSHEFVTHDTGSVRVCTTDGKERTLWKGHHVEGYFPSDDASPVISPTGHFVAFLTWPSEENEVLVVVDMQGRTVFKHDGVFAFSWSPDGHSILCVCGEGSSYFRKRTGAFVYGLKSKGRKQLSTEAYRACWAAFDNRIYIRCKEIKTNVGVYDPQTGTLAETNYEDVHFSPDGQFYFTTPEDYASQIFRRSDNTDVTAEFFPQECRDDLSCLRWLGSSYILAREAGRERGSNIIVLDLKAHKVRAIEQEVVAFVEDIPGVVLLDPVTNKRRIMPIEKLRLRTKTEEE